MRAFLILLATAIVLLVVILLAIQLHVSSKEQIISKLEESESLIVRQMEDRIEARLKESAQILRMLAYLDAKHGPGLEEMIASIPSSVQDHVHGAIRSAAVYDGAGTIVFSTIAEEVGQSHAQNDYFLWAGKAENRDKTFISSQIHSPEPDHFRFLLAHPLYEAQGQGDDPQKGARFTGVLTVCMDLDAMMSEQLAIDPAHGGTHHFWIIDTSGRLLYHPSHPEIAMRAVSPEDPTCRKCHLSLGHIQQIIKERDGVIEYPGPGGAPRLAAYVPLRFANASWIVVVNGTYGKITGYFQRELRQMLLLIAVVGLAIIGGAIHVSRSYHLKRKAETDARHWREKHALEEILRNSEERYRAIVECSHDIIWMLDCQGRFTFINSRGEAISGYRAEDWIGKDFVPLVVPQDLPLVQQRYAESLEGKDITYEVRVLDKNGGVFVLSVYSIPLKEEGRVVGTISFGSDVTQIRQNQEVLRLSYDKLHRILEETVHALASMVEKRDPYTAGHQRRVTQLACAIAGEMGLSDHTVAGIRIAGLLHDVGKIVVPAEILSKTGAINNTERSLIQVHAMAGYEIVRDIEFPWPVAEAIAQHHERMDGSGYPANLQGKEIILEAKIIMVADVVEAMTFHRPYRPAKGVERALQEIREMRGILYYAAVADACLTLFQDKGFVFE